MISRKKNCSKCKWSQHRYVNKELSKGKYTINEWICDSKAMRVGLKCKILHPKYLHNMRHVFFYNDKNVLKISVQFKWSKCFSDLIKLF